MSRLLLFVLSVAGCLVAANSMFVVSREDVDLSQLSRKQCYSGPSFWCASLQNARQCKATKHCIQTVWGRRNLPADNNNICQTCKDMVQQARDQLMSNETQEELREVFEGSCKLIPIKMIRNECIKVSDEFIPELVEMLASQMNPQMVCATAGLCNSKWVNQILAEFEAVTPNDKKGSEESCNDCEKFVNDTIVMLRGQSKDDILDKLLDLCGRTGSLSDGCRMIIVDNFEEIYDMLTQRLNGKSFCELFGLCSFKFSSKSGPRVMVRPLSNDRKVEAKIAAKPKDDLECEFCEALVKHARDMLTSNTTEAEFKTVLESICKQTKKFEKQCLSLVDEYYDEVYDFLMNEMDPKETCRMLSICPGNGLKATNSQTPLWVVSLKTSTEVKASGLVPAEPISTPMAKIQPANENHAKSDEPLIGLDEKNAMGAIGPLNQLPVERYMPSSLITALGRSGPGCVLCEYVLHEIVNDLANATVDKKLEDIVRNICHKMPSPIGDECSKFVDQYGDAFIYLLGQEMDPSRVCPMLKLCPGKAEEIVLPKNPFKASGKANPNTCALCEFVITELDKKLEDNKTEEAVKSKLDQLCDHMPQSIRKECRAFVDAYTNQLVEMILADFTPDEVCAALKLCTPKNIMGKSTTKDLTLGQFLLMAEKKELTLGEFLESLDDKPTTRTKESKPEKNVDQVAEGPMCVMCEFAMAELEKRLKANSTEDQIRRAIDFLCAHLPSTVADRCIEFVERYGDEVFELLLNELAPRVVCTQLGVCLLSEKTAAAVPAVLETNVEGPETCGICEITVEYLDKLLEDDTVEESIDHLVEKVCNIVPEKSREKCRGIVDTFGPYIISQLGIMADKRQVCESIHLCKGPAGKVHLLGGQQCTWGPAYWCSNTEQAKACNALEHCQTKVWMKAAP